jgi:predicted MFS family arabinose efflux permease
MTAAPSRTAARARAAVAVIFAIHGVVQGTFATRVPWIADHVGAEPGSLGLALLFVSVGAITAMPFTGRVVHHRPARVSVPMFLIPWCLTPVLAAQAPTVPLLSAALFLVGAMAGASDVAMNAQGVVVERAYGRSIMSGLHGMWSLGALAGASVGVVAAHTDVSAPVHFLVVGAVLTVGTLGASPWLMDAERTAGDDVPVFAVPPRPVVLIALIGFAGIFVEAAATDWAAVYLVDVAHASPAIGAAAYGGFAATMTLARFVGDQLVNRFGPVRTVRVGGVAATAGAILIAAARSPVPALAGFVLLGVGVSVAVPLAFAAAGKAGPRPAQQIAGVATIVYGAGMAAPAAIGGVAQAASLSVSFLLVSLLAAFIAVGAGALRVVSSESAEQPLEARPR